MQNLLWKVTIFALWPLLWVCGLALWTILCFFTWPLVFFAEIVFDDFASDIEDWWRK